MIFSRKSRWLRRGDVTAVLIGLSIVSSIFMLGRARRSNPEQVLAVIRMRIIQSAKDVEQAHSLRLTEPGRTDEQRAKDTLLYNEAKNHVLRAARVYNKMQGDYANLKQFAGSDREQVVALLAAAALAVKAERSGNTGR